MASHQVAQNVWMAPYVGGTLTWLPNTQPSETKLSTSDSSVTRTHADRDGTQTDTRVRRLKPASSQSRIPASEQPSVWTPATLAAARAKDAAARPSTSAHPIQHASSAFLLHAPAPRVPINRMKSATHMHLSAEDTTSAFAKSTDSARESRRRLKSSTGSEYPNEIARSAASVTSSYGGHDQPRAPNLHAQKVDPRAMQFYNSSVQGSYGISDQLRASKPHASTIDPRAAQLYSSGVQGAYVSPTMSLPSGPELYGREHIASVAASFLRANFGFTPESVFAPFVASIAHCTQIPDAGVYGVLLLLWRLKLYSPASATPDGRSLVLAAFMVYHKCANDRDFKDSAWETAGQGVVPRRELKTVERSLLSRLNWDVTIRQGELEEFARAIRKGKLASLRYVPKDSIEDMAKQHDRELARKGNKADRALRWLGDKMHNRATA